MRGINIYLVLALSLLAFGCSSLKVRQDYDVSTDFSGLKTFAWKSDKQPKTGDVRVDNPLLDARIRAAVTRSLNAKGFRKTTTGVADFSISYEFQIRRKIGSDSVRTGVGFGLGGGGSFGGVGVSSSGGVREYDEGMLVIDLTAPDSSHLLWRGTGTGQLSDRADPERIIADVEAAVDKILAQFPPQPN